MQINRAIATAQVETLALVREWNDDCDQAGESPKEKDLAQDLRHLTCTSFASFLFGMSSARAQVFAKERVVELVQTLMEHIAVYLAMGILPLGKIVFPVMLRSKFEEIRHKKERLHAIIRDQIQMAETVLPARHERVVRPILSHLEQSPESKVNIVRIIHSFVRIIQKAFCSQDYSGLYNPIYSDEYSDIMMIPTYMLSDIIQDHSRHNFLGHYHEIEKCRGFSAVKRGIYHDTHGLQFNRTRETPRVANSTPRRNATHQIEACS